MIRRSVDSDCAGIIQIAEKLRFSQSEKGVSERGFLLTALSPDDCLGFIRNETSYVAEGPNGLLGFVIATHPHSQRYETLSDPKLLWSSPEIGRLYEKERLFYLWQIGVDPSAHGQGIGQKLLAAAVSQADQYLGIFADFMISPVRNARSESFFSASGFSPSGHLDLSGYYGAGPSRYQIVAKLFGGASK